MLFQSTPSRGGRLAVAAWRIVIRAFQSTPSRGGRPYATVLFATTDWFQSTPSRGGRLYFPEEGSELEKVSIHALTRRATKSLCHRLRAHTRFNPRPHAEGDTRARPILPGPCGVSIHALTRRATYLFNNNIFKKLFQSTPSRGGRPTNGTWTYLIRAVSIHALTRRATSSFFNFVSMVLFQSTPSRGGRQDFYKNVSSILTFQSTPSRGGRHHQGNHRG